MNEPVTAPTDDGVLVLDDAGDRKKGSATDHVGRQYLGSVGTPAGGTRAAIQPDYGLACIMNCAARA